MSSIRSACFVLLCSATVLANTTTDVTTFDGGVNTGNWSYFGDPSNPVEVIEAAGGNPGAWLHSTCTGLNCLDTFAPQPRTQAGVASTFTGDYRGTDVQSVGVDLILLDVDFSAAERPLTIQLVNDGGTPGTPADDLIAYFVGPDCVPLVGEGWKSFDFAIPADSPTLPAGWTMQGASGAGADADWNTVIEDVDQVRFFYGDPEFFFIFQQWEPGLDNPRITRGNTCPGDLDGCGNVDFNDLIIVLSDWGPVPGCPPYIPADINEDCVVDFEDLLIVLSSWGPC